MNDLRVLLLYKILFNKFCSSFWHYFQRDVYVVDNDKPKRMTRRTAGIMKHADSYTSAMQAYSKCKMLRMCLWSNTSMSNGPYCLVTTIFMSVTQDYFLCFAYINCIRKPFVFILSLVCLIYSNRKVICYCANNNLAMIATDPRNAYNIICSTFEICVVEPRLPAIIFKLVLKSHQCCGVGQSWCVLVYCVLYRAYSVVCDIIVMFRIHVSFQHLKYNFWYIFFIVTNCDII